MAKSALMCSNVCKQFSKQQQCTPIIHYKGGDTFAYNRIPVVDTTIKLCPSTNPINKTYKTELHVCKQQHISFTCFSRYLKHSSRYVYEISQKPGL